MTASSSRFVLVTLLVGTMGLTAVADDDISPGDVPDVVRSALEEAAPGFVIEEAKLEEEDDGTYYKIEGSVGDFELEFVVMEDGSILEFEADDGYWPGDSDGDGLNDVNEYEQGTDPFDRDSDGDVYPDGFEIEMNSDPLDAASVPQIFHVQYDPESAVVSLELQTFEGAEFAIEQCTGDPPTWGPFGGTIVGDGSAFQWVVPLEEAIPTCLFRATVTLAEPGEPGELTNGSAPESLVGFDIIIERDGELIRLCFLNKKQGRMVIVDDDEVEFTPFGYTLRQIDECRIRLTLTFPTSDGYETEEYDLTLDKEGGGTYRLTRYEDGEKEDSESGTFRLQYHPANP